MKLGHKDTRPATKRERIMMEYQQWETQGRPSAPTARILAGMYSVLYRKRYRLLPISPVQDDIEAFDAMLSILSDDLSVAPYCIEYLFSLKEFTVKANAFSNPRVIDRWNVVEHANKLRSRNGVGSGEQAEFRSDSKKFGVIRA